MISSCVLLVIVSLSVVDCILFRPEQFQDLSEECRRSRKPIRRILDESKSAAYLRVDPGNTVKRRFSAPSTMTTTTMTSSIGYTASHGNLTTSPQQHFDCIIQIETQLPPRDKDADKFDALSLIIIELNNFKKDSVKIATFGDQNRGHRTVTEAAHYSDRVWASTNPNFLLSGQLSGFDSIDYRSKIHPQHIVKPEQLRSSWDRPASITVNLTNWSKVSHIYMIFTSYKYLKKGQCQKHKEFDCSSPAMGFLSGGSVASGGSSRHMCMSVNLACDGLPNCGQDFLPNQDENCFKIHWSSVLLSLVSYILLAITLLLCLSCFARVLIQWSVRSSLVELRGGGSNGPGSTSSPAGSFRSSSRFFSFLGTTFAGRWERPPPTYDEAMKHVNPDITRPSQQQQPPPPAYHGSSTELRPWPRNDMVETPPPEYESREALNHARLDVGPPRMEEEEEENDRDSTSCPTLNSTTEVSPGTSTISDIPTSSSTDFGKSLRTFVPLSQRNKKKSKVTTEVEAEICVGYSN